PTGARSARATCTRTRAACAAGGRSKRRSRSPGPRRGGGTAPSPREWPSGARGQTMGCGARASSQAVLLLGFVLGEAANARVRPAELGVEQRGGVLVLTRLADDRGLPVGLGGSAERLGGLLREQRPELLPRVDERREVLDELPGERVLDDRDRRHLAHRALRR